MKKIILIKISYPWGLRIAPMGLLYVGGALKKQGFEVKIIHRDQNNVQDLADYIVNSDPLFVGFSVCTADPMRAIAGICRKVKTLNKGIPLIFGGIHPTLLPEQCLNEDYIDFVVLGEGESAVVELSKKLSRKKDFENVLSIGFKSKGKKPVINPRMPLLANLDDYSMDWSLVRIEDYIYHYENIGNTINYVSSRGCPHNCGFCYNSAFNKCKWRAHSADKIIEEINDLKRKYNLDGIMFDDDNFFVDKERAFNIMENIGLYYHVEARVDSITDEFVQRLDNAGCRILLLGTESGSNRILKLVRKGFDRARIDEAINILARHPTMRVACSAIFGYPTETMAEYRKTLLMLLKHMKKHSFVTYTTGFYLPYPGTELYDMVKASGFNPPVKTEDWEDLDRWGNKKFNINWVNWLSSVEVKKVRNLIYIFGKLCHKNKLIILRKAIELRLVLSTYGFYKAVMPLESFILRYKRYLRALLKFIGLIWVWEYLKGE